MEAHLILLTSLLVISANICVSSSHHHYHDFLECLTDQFQRLNSTTDGIYTPQNSTYASLLQATNQRPQSNSPRRPDLIITPYHESEIRAVISCSKKLGLQTVVRSGGHDFEGLSYTSRTPFVIIDMRELRSVTIDNAEKTAWVQSGSTLGQFYHALAQNSKTLVFAAGVCPTVGIGGQFSGGGYGMMARKHSIAADHIIDAKLINSDGEVLDRRTMGEDLFWAIRGGGGTSFGIVLEFKVSLVTVPEIVTVFNVTRTLEENATELVHKWQHIADKVDDNLLLRVFFRSVGSPTNQERTVAVSFTTLYLGQALNLVPLMQEKFPEIGLVEQDCREMSWIESVLFLAGLSGQPQDVLLDRTAISDFTTIYYKVKSDYIHTPIPVSGLTGIWRFLQEDELFAEIQFSPYGGAISAFSESETPFPHRKGNIFMIEYAVVWFKPNDTDRHMNWINKLYSYMARYATKSPRAAYANYRDLDLGRNNIEEKTSYAQASVWGFRYFKDNFKRLVRVKTKIDSSNFFRNEQSIPPLSSEEMNKSFVLL